MQQNNKNEPVAPPSVSRDTSAECGRPLGSSGYLEVYCKLKAGHNPPCSPNEAAPLSGEGGERPYDKEIHLLLLKIASYLGEIKQLEALRCIPAVASQGQKDAPSDEELLLNYDSAGSDTDLDLNLWAELRTEILRRLALRVGGSPARSVTFEQAVKELLDAMETCHICEGKVLLQGHPVYCQDCSADCERHDEPECTSIAVLYDRVSELLAALPGSLPTTEWKNKFFDLAACVRAGDAEGAYKLAMNESGSLPSPAPQPLAHDLRAKLIGNLITRWDMMTNDFKNVVDEEERNFYTAMHDLVKAVDSGEFWDGPSLPSEETRATDPWRSLIGPQAEERCWERMCKSFHDKIAEALGLPKEPEPGFHAMLDAIKRGAASPAEWPTPDARRQREKINWGLSASIEGQRLSKQEGNMPQNVTEICAEEAIAIITECRQILKLDKGQKLTDVLRSMTQIEGSSAVFNAMSVFWKESGRIEGRGTRDCLNPPASEPKPSPRCPKCGTAIVWESGDRYAVCSLALKTGNNNDFHQFEIRSVADFAQFFTPSAGEPQPHGKGTK